MLVAVAATRSTAALASATVRSLTTAAPGLDVQVLAADDADSGLQGEAVTLGRSVGLPLERLRMTHDDDALTAALTIWWAADVVQRHGEAVLALAPGTVLLSSPTRLLGDPTQSVALARTASATPDAVKQPSVLSTELFVLGTAATAHVSALKQLAEGWSSAERALDLFLARVPHQVHADDAALVSRWNSDETTLLAVGGGSALARDGRNVIALDLAGFDATNPWLFDARGPQSTGPLLSVSPALAEVVRATAPAAGTREPSRVDAPLVRSIARVAGAAGQDLDDAAERLDDWLLDLVPPGDRAPVARYLAGIRADRPDLRAAFPLVPGRDSGGLARWALEHGVREPGVDPDLLSRAARRTVSAQPDPEPAGTVRPHGVNLVGYLAGELGVGTSARLMDAALTAAGIPTSTFAVTRDLQSRARAEYRRTDPVRYDTTLIAVNADQTPAVVGALDDVTGGTYRIGMWYWEVEAFPADRAPAFTHVDEVWAATDFVREAIAARSPVPVRTVLPPLPQRTAEAAPPVPDRLGVPSDRPWFLFAFDYLSTAERKNPWGLVEAFARAFAPEEGPVLVIKTINAKRRPAEAERLRLVAAGRPDVVVIDEYLEQDELTALTARCTAYVSLHRAEGLGLTVAEAMAWGRPVVVSAYSGNMQFTTARNTFLVPCSPTPIPPNVPPYPEGTPWGAPDLNVAAAHLRRIVEAPDEAAAVGRQAAEDIRTLHSPEAAGRRIHEVVEEIWQQQDVARVKRERAAAAQRRTTARIARRLRRFAGDHGLG